MSFDRHMEVFNAAHQWTLDQIETLVASGDTALAAILGQALPEVSAPAAA